MSTVADVQMRLEPADLPPLLQFRGDEMQNEDFTILVFHFLLGQFRIKITDLRLPDLTAPEGHGSIVQELCTYQHATLARVITELRHSPDPLELARSWAKPFNCEYRGGRIRLDNQPSDRREVATS